MEKEKIILAALLRNPDYFSLAMPFLKEEYFTDKIDSKLFRVIKNYWDKYECVPTTSALQYEALHEHEVAEEVRDEILSTISIIYAIEIPDKEWLKDESEKFCQEKASYNVIMQCIDIYSGDSKKKSPSIIPDMLRDAINIKFDIKIGHNWLRDAEARFDYYTNPVARIPFRLDTLNLITNNGVPRKTFNIVLGGVNCGKTGFLCSLAADYVQQGYNVLYVTFEMREEEIAKRIDANILGLPLGEMGSVSEEEFMNSIHKIRQKTFGQLVIQEFESGIGNSQSIAHVMRELKNRDDLSIDVIVVDYIGICGSFKVSHSSVNSYTYQKYVAEELRNLGFTFDCAVWAGMQQNRSGFNSNSPEMTDAADSFAVPATADFMLALSRTEELDEVNKVLCTQLKSRYANKSDLTRFCLGVNQELQQYYDVQNYQIGGLVQSQEDEKAVTATLKRKGGGTAEKFAGIK